MLVAFALLLLCIAPLLTPHIALYHQEKEYVKQVQLDHAVNLLYTKLLEKLYLNQIPLEQLEDPKPTPITPVLLQEALVEMPFPYEGSYSFGQEPPRFKPKEGKAPFSFYLYKLLFNFHPLNKKRQQTHQTPKGTFTYEYQLFVIHKREGGK